MRVHAPALRLSCAILPFIAAHDPRHLPGLPRGHRPPRIAFVASGGGTRGIAHLGVLKACEEFGIRFDVFVGASTGAIVGATYGQGIPLDRLLDAWRLPWNRRHRERLRFHPSDFFGLPAFADMFDPGYLTSGLFDLRRLERLLHAHLPHDDFRNVANTVLITAVDVDVNGGGRVVFGRGHDDATPISKAVAASCCVPGLFRPYRIGDRYYLDGEIVRGASVDLAVDAGAEVVIVSDTYRAASPTATGPSIARRGPFAVLTQALDIALGERDRRELDRAAHTSPHVSFIHIAPDLDVLGWLDRFHARPLVLRGYREALRELAAAKDRGAFDPRAGLKLARGA